MYVSYLITITKHFWPFQVVISHFLATTFRDITLCVVNNHRIGRKIFTKVLNKYKENVIYFFYFNHELILKSNNNHYLFT